jgi:hypothetical protein
MYEDMLSSLRHRIVPMKRAGVLDNEERMGFGVASALKESGCA